jgi:hypothetical protein
MIVIIIYAVLLEVTICVYQNFHRFYCFYLSIVHYPCSLQTVSFITIRQFSDGFSLPNIYILDEDKFKIYSSSGNVRL